MKMLCGVFYFLMVSCVVVQALCYSSALFVDDKVPHVIMLSCRTIYVVTLFALYLLGLFIKRCGDITLVRRQCKHAVYHRWCHLKADRSWPVESTEHVCNVTQIKMWCDTHYIFLWDTHFSLVGTFLVISVLSSNSSLIYVLVLGCPLVKRYCRLVDCSVDCIICR
jgi:hypothetical protein